MRTPLVFVGVFLLSSTLAFADGTGDSAIGATVISDDGADVFSGTGSRDYVTTRLQKGDQVRVVRREPNGWLAIQPPPSSFSWVSSSFFSLSTDLYREYIRGGGGISTVTKNRAAVYAGSDVNPGSASGIQLYLSKGDTVNVLETKKLRLGDGPREMFKITPVEGELRWIRRDAVKFNSNDSAYDSNASQTSDIGSTPTLHVGPSLNSDDQSNDGFPTAQTNRTDDGGRERRSPRRRRPRPASLDLSKDDFLNERIGQSQSASRRRLMTIDDQFRQMIKQETLDWDLDTIERRYQFLNDDADDERLTATIRLRLDAVKRYRTYQNECLDFAELTSVTHERDAELQLRQTSYQSVAQAMPTQVSSISSQPIVGPQTLIGLQPANPPQPTIGMQPTIVIQSPNGLQTAPQWQAGQQIARQSQDFDGTGVVRRVTEVPGGPRYALSSTDGQLVTYLNERRGVDLSRYEGQTVGVKGRRNYRREWQADSITVRDIQPFQQNILR